MQSVFDRGQGTLIPPRSVSLDQGANPTDYLILLCPVLAGRMPHSVVEIFQRPNPSVKTQRGYLRFLQQMCELADRLLKTGSCRTSTSRSETHDRLFPSQRARLGRPEVIHLVMHHHQQVGHPIGQLDAGHESAVCPARHTPGKSTTRKIGPSCRPLWRGTSPRPGKFPCQSWLLWLVACLPALRCNKAFGSLSVCLDAPDERMGRCGGLQALILRNPGRAFAVAAPVSVLSSSPCVGMFGRSPSRRKTTKIRLRFARRVKQYQAKTSGTGRSAASGPATTDQ